MKILLTGANGFIGRLLVRHWADRHELTTVEGRAAFADQLRGDGYDLLVHAGFEVDFGRNQRSVDANLSSARAIAQFCRKGRAKRLLFLSGAAVLGVANDPLPRDEQAFGSCDEGYARYAGSAYVRAKVECEKLFREENVPLSVLYLTTVFGAGMAAGTRSSLETSFAPPGGTSLVGADDFLAAMNKFLGSPRSGAWVVNGENILFRDLIGAARRARGLRPPRVIPPVAKALVPVALPLLGSAGCAVLESAFGFKYYSAARFTRDFGWVPSQTWLGNGPASFFR